jgi:FMN phosphatase YigB (HAD superfamily)
MDSGRLRDTTRVTSRRTLSAPLSPVPIPALAQAIAGFPIVSCDVFDTAVRRRLARSEDVLLATGARAAARGLVSCTPAAFREYRIEAERTVRRDIEAAGHDEVRIAEVYERLVACGIGADADVLAEIELAVERSVCVADEALRAVLMARPPGQRLLFLSDTMLSGVAIAKLLSEAGYGDECLVFTSADARRSKHTGRLFGHVIAALGCAPADIVHLGDNPRSDVARAQENGITALYLKRANPPPEPANVSATHHLVRLVHSHRRRAAQDRDPASLSPRGDAGAFALHRYFSLLLIGFTLFILAEAKRRNIRRIYFLARDGYLPLAIAKRLVARTGNKVELTYLHVSRQSIVAPTLIDDLPRLAADMESSMHGLPLRAALEALGIDRDTATRMLRDDGVDPEQPIVGPLGEGPIRRVFDAHRDTVVERLQARRATALAYLDEAGFLAPGPRLLVDVGWRGTIQKALSTLTGVPGGDIAGCYIGLWPQALTPGFDPRTAAGYLFSFGHPKPMLDIVLEGYALLELFLSAPHGAVSHYAARGTRMEPVHAVELEPGASLRRQAFAALEQGCVEEFEMLDSLLDGAWPEEIDPGSAIFDLAPLLTCPTAREVAAVNTIPFIHGASGERTSVAIKLVPLHQLLLSPDAALRRFENSPWRAGSIRASLPWPVPSMSFHDLRHRVERIRRLLGRT